MPAKTKAAPDTPSAGKSILTTFAGRRDRMGLLCRYARAALARGIIDEWHVWDFSRNPADAAWLRQEFPAVRMTPGNGLDYFTAPRRLRAAPPQQPPVRPKAQSLASLRLSVAATNDVHIGLCREQGAGQSYEIVLGGWGNNYSVVRAYDDPDMLRFPARRAPNEPHVLAEHTPGLLAEWGFADVSLTLDTDGLRVRVNDREIIALPGPIAAGEFSVLYRSGFGADAEWRFPEAPGAREFLFLPAPPRAETAAAPALFYLPFYRHYARQRVEYADDLLLKCDDDIVFFDLDGLRRFIAYRRAHPEYFLLSANVVNNGVCAWFQQEHGVFPRDLLDLELPPHGLCGSLWGSREKAETLHDHFLHDPARFTATTMGTIDWRYRISINFIALLGSDLAHIPDSMADDEDFLSYGGRVRARKPNAIFGPFCAVHLTFGPQDGGFNHARILTDYAALAARHIG